MGDIKFVFTKACVPSPGKSQSKRIKLIGCARRHAVFVDLVRQRLATRQHPATSVEASVEASAEAETGSRLAPVWQRNRPADLPVFRSVESGERYNWDMQHAMPAALPKTTT